MKIVLIGVGKVGEKMVEYLSKSNHDVVIVDIDYKRVEALVNKYDVKGVVGGGVERSVLTDAEVSDADFFIACTSRDELNVLSCVMAKRLGAKNTVARVRSPEYFEEMETIRSVLGLDMVFNPEYRTAVEIANLLKFPSAVGVESFAGGKAKLLEFHIEDGHPLIGRSVQDILKESYVKVLFALVTRGNKVFIPKGDFVVAENDSVHIIASESDLVLFSKKNHLFKRRSKSVFIVGGSRTAYYLAREFEGTDVAVKILDIDPKRCKELSESLSQTTVLCGDGTDQSVLDEERIDAANACVTLTGIDEENVLISLYAAQKKVYKVITKVNRTSILKMVKNLGLESVVSPHTVIANHILQFIRSRMSSSGEGLNALYKISEKAEALEFTVGEKFKNKGVPLKSLKIRREVLIGGIVRDEEFILPSGETYLMQGDKVIVVTTEKDINDLEQILR